MIRLGPDEARCLVRTRREGLLSAVGHDLVLEVGRFEIALDVEAGTAVAEFEVDSLRVVGALVDGRADETSLSPADRATIEGHAKDDVLGASAHPRVTFEANGLALGGLPAVVSGALQVRGVTREVAAHCRLEAGHGLAVVTVHQPDFGIAPYRAMLGALRVHADVEVEISVEGYLLSGIAAQP